ncbi:MAG TPA: RagB/SusD family nutrient uptake outer membrane protein [Bacteroidales bacterium]
MKRSYYLLIFLSCTILSLLSCKKQSFLDKTESTDLNEETVFADSTYAMNFLNGIYVNVGFSSSPTRFSTIYTTYPGLESACDEAEGYVSGAGNTYIQFATGTVSSTIVSKDAWQTPYTEIRAVNMLLKHLSKVPVTDGLKKKMKAEARFLRAWYYFILLEHYGGVPLVGDTLYTSSDVIPQSRNTFEECVNYIVAESDSAANVLPWIQSGNDYGRANKAACKALKARTLLYAASPLFNGGGIATTEPLKSITGYPSYDKERWKLAQDAAEEVIDPGKYSLYVDNATAPGYGFYEVFLLRESSELIFAKMQGDNKYLEGIWLPPSTNGTPITFPYLEMANAFGMMNGLPITDPASNYNPDDPYSNRDPRFNYSIIHDQTKVMRYPDLQRIAVNIYIDATDPNNVFSGLDAPHKGTLTGYYPFKMVDEDVDPIYFAYVTKRCMPLIRYAEILLDYAEARNEYLDAPDQNVYDAVEAIRSRAGLNPYTLAVGLTQSEMRDIIRSERRVELAFEGHRFWDVRRWKIAPETDNVTLHGTEWTKTSSGMVSKTFDVRKHNFTDNMYLWPIPESEVSKSPELLQNPGY